MLRVDVSRGLDGKFQKLKDIVEGYAGEYFRRMSDEIVFRSPVDTGTYMDAHRLGTSASGTSMSSRGKLRKQPWQPFAQSATARLHSSASSLASASVRNAVFYNVAHHWREVEYQHGYAVYSSAAREHGRIAREAAEAARARNR